jgi:hypothetical protein
MYYWQKQSKIKVKGKIVRFVSSVPVQIVKKTASKIQKEKVKNERED